MMIIVSFFSVLPIPRSLILVRKKVLPWPNFNVRITAKLKLFLITFTIFASAMNADVEGLR